MRENVGFEARLAASLQAYAGPPRPVDVAAVVSTAAGSKAAVGAGRDLRTALAPRRFLFIAAAVATMVVLGAFAVGSGLVKLVPLPTAPTPASTGSPEHSPGNTSSSRSASPTHEPDPATLPGLILLDAVGNVGQRLWLTDPTGSTLHQFEPKGTASQNELINRGFGGAWWPDGQRLFLRGNVDQYLANVDGTGVRTVAAADWADIPGGETEAMSRSGENWPNWSPDHRSIVSSEPLRNAGSQSTQAYVIDLSTGIRRDLPVPPDLCVAALHWSPDGTLIVMTTGRPPVTGGQCAGVEPGNHDIYVIRADGTGLTALTADHASAWASWTPDGRLVYFHADGLWVMDADGANAGPISAGLAELSRVIGARISTVDWGIRASWQPLP